MSLKDWNPKTNGKLPVKLSFVKPTDIDSMLLIEELLRLGNANGTQIHSRMLRDKKDSKKKSFLRSLPMVISSETNAWAPGPDGLNPKVISGMLYIRQPRN